ncbi:MAG TPA: DNA gyrase inhibitor YacG [Phycisphaerae bacterium]|jgi:hypothetical protein
MITFLCPICGKQLSVEQREDAPHRPFCSERCKLVDLGRWLDGTYRIPDETPAPRPAPEPVIDENERRE